ncbi:hypothetical protein [Microcystis phage Mvi-JY20]|uniref:Uncharacterized protein n=1 Tax=Microcystis phage Mvi-JY20 TaxID=3128146 RepID=A0AAX4QIE2_9CAUD
MVKGVRIDTLGFVEQLARIFDFGFRNALLARISQVGFVLPVARISN